HEDSSVKSSKDYEDSYIIKPSMDRENSNLKSSKDHEKSQEIVMNNNISLTEQLSQVASPNHKSNSEKVITVEQIKQELNDNIMMIDEKEKNSLPEKIKRPRRSNRETYAYLNMLPKRRTRQQSQSEWRFPHNNFLPQVSRQSSQPKRRKLEKPLEHEKSLEHKKPMEYEIPVISKPIEPEVLPLHQSEVLPLHQSEVLPLHQSEVSPLQQSEDQVTTMVSCERDPYKPRNLDIQNVTTRRSVRQANKKESVISSNDNEKVNIKREKVYIKKEFENGQNLMMIEERAVNECLTEVDQLVEQESDEQ
ncbi:5098_t:CDS:2, partial [Scutellospora calospora]